MVFESLTEALMSTDPGKLYRALHVCSNEYRRELSRGRERGAYLGAMSSAHYANRFLTTLEDSPPMTSFGIITSARRSNRSIAEE
jgi:hypothetical protein